MDPMFNKHHTEQPANTSPRQNTTTPSTSPAPGSSSSSARQNTPAPSTNPDISQLVAQLIRHVLQKDALLLPIDPTTNPITSTHIDNIAYAMWNTAFQHGALLDRACQYGSMFSPLKLAALARLNFLPSWWFFRSFAVGYLQNMGIDWIVDDADMIITWESAVRGCVEVFGIREARAMEEARVREEARLREEARSEEKAKAMEDEMEE